MESQPSLFTSDPPVSRAVIWRERFKLVIFVVFCIELGIFLIAYPWTPWWTENSLLVDYPRLASILSTGVIRGMVSGLGILDIWIGIWQAIRYREKPRER